MRTFEYNLVPRVIFGRKTFAKVKDTLAALGSRPLIVYNGSDDYIAGLSAQGVEGPTWRQRGEPTVADVDAGTRQAIDSGCDCIIGIGGGSAIDCAKAVAGLVTNGGSAQDYMEVVGKGSKITRLALPWLAIPTTAGTGAEATRNAVVGLPEKQFKASIRSELLLPRLALIDPELGAAVPPEVTASSGMDALCQCIEAYTSSGASPLTDGLALQGIRLAVNALPKVYRDGQNLDAREEMAMAALLSGIALTNAGLGAVHGFAAPLGANFPVPHGTACAALLPHVIAANVAALHPSSSKSSTLLRYATIGRILAGDDGLDETEALVAAVGRPAQLARELRIPPLSRYGLTEAHVPEMVALARRSSSMRYNPVELPEETLAHVLRSAINPAS